MIFPSLLDCTVLKLSPGEAKARPMSRNEWGNLCFQLPVPANYCQTQSAASCNKVKTAAACFHSVNGDKIPDDRLPSPGFALHRAGKWKTNEACFNQTRLFCFPWVPLERVTRLARRPSEGLSCSNLRLQNSEEKRSHHVAVQGPHRVLIMRQAASLKAMRLAHKRTRHQKASSSCL